MVNEIVQEEKQGYLKLALRSSCCAWYFKALSWLPVFFIVVVIIWSYYTYVIQLCIGIVKNLIEKILYLIFYHISFFIMFWTYWKTIFTEIGRIPKEFYLLQVDREKLEKEETEENLGIILQNAAKNLPVVCRTKKGDFRYCVKCQAIKPDRSHHCSACGICVLKMDHHCPWVNTCVGFTNYKYFVLLLGYGLVYCIFIALTVMQYFIKFWSPIFPFLFFLEGLGTGRFHILFLFLVAIIFSICIVFLFGFHCYLIAHNRTTLESLEAPIFYTGPDKNGFSLDKFSNFLEVFGKFKLMWFLPMFTSLGNGVSFPTRTVDNDTDTLLGNRQRWLEDGETETELSVIQRLDRAALKGFKGENLNE